MSFIEKIDARLAALRAAQRHRSVGGEEGISFCHNDYLGLARHPQIIEAGRRALAAAGAGSRGSRLLGGNTEWHEAAETSIAAFFGAPAARLFSSGYLANVGTIQALASLTDIFVADERIHASLIDGIRLSKRPKVIVPHQRWDTAPESLSGQAAVLIAESLYSMDGDIVEERALRGAVKRAEAFLVLDESHAGGVFFEDGRGIGTPGCDWERTAVVVTFGKAFGVGGAAVLGSRAFCDLLVNEARTFIYSTAPPPAVAAMVSAAIDVAAEEQWRRRELWARAERVRQILRDGLGPDTPLPPRTSAWNERSPILPFLVPGDDRALRLSQSMRDSGWNLRAIRYPTVARGAERLRISISLAVDGETTERMASDLVRQWRQIT